MPLVGCCVRGDSVAYCKVFNIRSDFDNGPGDGVAEDERIGNRLDVAIVTDLCVEMLNAYCLVLGQSCQHTTRSEEQKEV